MSNIIMSLIEMGRSDEHADELDFIHSLRFCEEHGQAWAICNCGCSFGVHLAEVNGEECVVYEQVSGEDEMFCELNNNNLR